MFSSGFSIRDAVVAAQPTACAAVSGTRAHTRLRAPVLRIAVMDA